jgi:hypothetical protein
MRAGVRSVVRPSLQLLSPRDPVSRPSVASVSGRDV